MEAWPFDQNAPCGIPEYGFYGVPSGDANYSASTFSVPFAPPTKEEILSFERILMERTSTLRSGEGRYEVTITAVSSVDVYGYQLGVKFDEKSYEYEKVKSGNQELKQDDRNYNTKNEKTIKGELRTSWVSDLSKTSKIPATKEFEVFKFNLKVKDGNSKIENSVSLSDLVLKSEFSSLTGVIEAKKLALFLKIRPLNPNED